MKEITEDEASEFIAKQAGWTIRSGGGYYEPPDHRARIAISNNLPNYFNDADREALFWIHQAEKTLDDGIEDAGSLRYRYSAILYDATPAQEQPFRAPASRRAHAFLAVHGYKLKETK